MRFSFPYDVYTNPVRTMIETLNGQKRFDLRGEHRDEQYGHPREIYAS